MPPACGPEGQEGEPGPGGPSVPLAVDVRGRGIRGVWKRGSSMNMAEGDTLISVDYEVFGKVQGVFFRKYTQAESKRLGLVGWVQNTDQGTVQGQLQGPISKVRHMQEWLETKGSPKSHIDRANFNNEKVILKLDYSDFQIVK
ncbi:PREDICTED: acylphosphatase-1 isoform X2 [Myotis brandtii]|nr:PREDICTED: acylphosphatase-1 isoform X1 [Myotis brandtii]XP_014386685.1 PREDICTED: acylphosphatase-1 isoform X2 [Myotis brandtii]